MNYIYELEMKVRDYECDLQGIVNNANYQHYLEHTRHEFLTSVGVSFAALHEQGVDPVVARISMAFKTPLKSGDEFVSKLYMKKEGIKYVFYQDIFRKNDNKVVVKSTAIGKYGGYDKNINAKEFQRSFNAFNAMWQMAYGINFSKADDGAVSMLPDYMQDYVRHRQSLDKFSDQEDELSFKKMMEHNLKMLKLLFGEIDKDGKKSKDFMDSFLKFSMPPLNLVKELNENPAGKYLVDMLGIKRDVDIKA